MFVSACNRTYYGEVGYSYRLNVKKLSKERPFLCHLSFTASGQEHGDFVEVSFRDIMHSRPVRKLFEKKKTL